MHSMVGATSWAEAQVLVLQSAMCQCAKVLLPTNIEGQVQTLVQLCSTCCSEDTLSVQPEVPW